MTSDLPEENREPADDNDIDWDNRILCSDGNCIGVIGPDGHCKECGKKYEGELPETAISEPSDQPDIVKNEELLSTATEEDPIEELAAADKWENRVLCSDGNCIGVIGPDGKCKECGKPLGTTNGD